MERLPAGTNAPRPSAKAGSSEKHAIFEPGGMVFEADRFTASTCLTVQRAHTFQAGCEIDVNLDITHCGSRIAGGAGYAPAISRQP